MNSDIKKQYAMRISQANNVQMIIISYEIIETYLEEAYSAADDACYAENIELAKRCIDEMMNNLHYEYELAKNLKELYLYMKKKLRQSVWENDKNSLLEVKNMVASLRKSYESVADQDSSQAIMQNTQSVVAGMTYGRNQILEEVSQDAVNRGYRI